MGDGASDSSIDVSPLSHFPADSFENIESIICRKEDPRVDSNHDIVASKYQPSGEGGTRSLPATLHRLQNPK